MMRDAKITQIYEGTQQIQRLVYQSQYDWEGEVASRWNGRTANASTKAVRTTRMFVDPSHGVSTVL